MWNSRNNKEQTPDIAVQQIVVKLKENNSLTDVEEALKTYQIYLNNIIKNPTDILF